MKYKIPTLMATQHPDSTRYVRVQDEVDEALQDLLPISRGGYGCDEKMIDYEGKLRWKVPYPGQLEPITPILGDINGNIFIALGSEYILSYDKNGNKRFEVQTPWFGDIVNGALSDNGRLYVGSSQKLICIK